MCSTHFLPINVSWGQAEVLGRERSVPLLPWPSRLTQALWPCLVLLQRKQTTASLSCILDMTPVKVLRCFRLNRLCLNTHAGWEDAGTHAPKINNSVAAYLGGRCFLSHRTHPGHLPGH
jgi:hypothetical protein